MVERPRINPPSPVFESTDNVRRARPVPRINRRIAKLVSIRERRAVSNAGILILDTNCYPRLESADKLACLRANTRATGFIAQPSELNLVEIAATSPNSIRDRLLATMREVANGNALLPWPFKLLHEIGLAIASGTPSVSVQPSGKEWYLDDFAAVGRLREEALEFQKSLEKTFSGFHARSRKRLQGSMRSCSVRDEFGSARGFLEGFWGESDMRRDFAGLTWSALRLPGDAPVAKLELNEPWRLLLDAEGVAVYERAIARVQPKFVQRMDLLQLVYLGIAQRRMLASADAGLLRAANTVLSMRYNNARALHIAELID